MGSCVDLPPRNRYSGDEPLEAEDIGSMTLISRKHASMNTIPSRLRASLMRLLALENKSFVSKDASDIGSALEVLSRESFRSRGCRLYSAEGLLCEDDTELGLLTKATC